MQNILHTVTIEFFLSHPPLPKDPGKEFPTLDNEREGKPGLSNQRGKEKEPETSGSEIATCAAGS